MGKEGPCFHCGIEYTPLWRHGPPAKPVLCNACGSRWRIRKTLDNYMPKNASASKASGSKDTQSYQQGELPPEEEPVIPMRAHSCKKPNVGPNSAGFDHCSAGFEEYTKNKSSSESAISLSSSCIQMGSINGQDIPGSFQPAFWTPHVPTRKKSVLKQHILSPVERLQRQLYNILQEPEFSMLSTDEDILIYDSNKTPTSETALGAMLLKSPAASSSERDTKPRSSAAETDACCTSDPPVESPSSQQYRTDLLGCWWVKSLRPTKISRKEISACMGKEGPCFHCGIEYTPLWRHGPPDKPVLCNACGSRWRIRKTLDNYMPKHANASKIIGSTDNQSYQQGKLPLEVKPDIPMRVDNCKMPNLGANIANFDHYSAGSEDDIKNGSSSGSAISLSESCIQMGSINGKDIPGSSQPVFWKPHVPTRKKSMRKQRVLSTVERLQRQLYNILQEPEFSMLSKNENEDVLIYDDKRMPYTETALGAMLLKSPTAATEKDTKANSSAVVQSETCCTSDPPVESSSG